MTNALTGRVTVFGYGPTGEATVERLRARGQTARVVQRKRPANLPADVEFMACDVLKAEDVLAAMRGAEQAVVTIGFEYSGKVWKRAWPIAMANLIAAAETIGARVVLIDNMYMYGPQTGVLTEETSLTRYGVKPAVRAKITRMWMEASAAGRVRFTALRAPDFYGAGVDRSHIGETGLAAIANGKSATLIMHPDNPHDFAYVPDIGRAAVMLLDAPDDAYGQAWHAPCAPTRSPRQLLKIGADALGVKLKVTAIPHGMLSVLGVFVPFLRECVEMSFTWKQAYRVDSSKFTRRFGLTATPFEVGVRDTALAFRAAAEAAKSGEAKPGEARPAMA